MTIFGIPWDPLELSYLTNSLSRSDLRPDAKVRCLTVSSDLSFDLRPAFQFCSFKIRKDMKNEAHHFEISFIMSEGTIALLPYGNALSARQMDELMKRHLWNVQLSNCFCNVCTFRSFNSPAGHLLVLGKTRKEPFLEENKLLKLRL